MNDVPRKRRGGGHGGSSLPVVRLKSERKYVHPLIFQKMVERPGERIVPGSLV